MWAFFEDVYKSFKGGDSGFSSRKLTVFTIVIMVIGLHYRIIFSLKYPEFVKIAEQVLIDDYIAIGFILGLFKVDDLITLRTGKRTEVTKTETSITEKNETIT